MQQTFHKQKITLNNYIYLELPLNFQPRKLTFRLILLCNVIDQKKAPMFAKEGVHKTNIFTINLHRNFLRQLL